jgi:predicted nucleic acid-binding protein
VKTPVLLDTGPLVALLAADDAWHEQCTKELPGLDVPLLTCWPVLTEAAWLLKDHPVAVQQMLHWVRSGIVKVLPIGDEATIWIMAFLRKYQKIRPQLADACLVYLAEEQDIDTIFTLDRRDFSSYRLGRNRSLTLLPR